MRDILYNISILYRNVYMAPKKYNRYSIADPIFRILYEMLLYPNMVNKTYLNTKFHSRNFLENDTREYLSNHVFTNIALGYMGRPKDILFDPAEIGRPTIRSFEVVP